MIVGAISLIYIFWNIIRLNKEKQKKLKELEIVYSIGLKEYNKSLCNQFKPSILPK
jgi:hypothetical protein